MEKQTKKAIINYAQLIDDIGASYYKQLDRIPYYGKMQSRPRTYSGVYISRDMFADCIDEYGNC